MACIIMLINCDHHSAKVVAICPREMHRFGPVLRCEITEEQQRTQQNTTSRQYLNDKCLNNDKIKQSVY